MVHPGVRDVVHHHFRLRHLDQPSLAAALALVERGLQRERHVRAGIRVGVVGGRRLRGIRVPVAAHQGVTGQRLHRRSEALEIAVGAAQAEAGEADHDQLRIDLGQRRPVDAEMPGDGLRVVLDEGVRVAHEFQEQLVAALAVQIERDALVGALRVVEEGVAVPEALARIAVHEARPGRALALPRRDVPVEGSRRVEVLDRLDLDHLRAEVREDHRAERPGPDDRLREHAHALQRQPGGRLARCLRGHQTTFRWRSRTTCSRV